MTTKSVAVCICGLVLLGVAGCGSKPPENPEPASTITGETKPATSVIRDTIQAAFERESGQRFLSHLMASPSNSSQRSRQAASRDLAKSLDVSETDYQSAIDAWLQSATQSGNPRQLAMAALWQGKYEEISSTKSTDRDLLRIAGTATLARYRDTGDGALVAPGARHFQNLLKQTPTSHPELPLVGLATAELIVRAGNYDASVPILQLLDQKLRDSDQDLLRATIGRNLARCWIHQGDFPAAETQFRRTVDSVQKHYGEETPETSAALNNLSNFLWDQGRLPDAEKELRRAVTCEEKFQGREGSQLALRYADLGQLLKAQGKLAEAEPFMRQSVALDEKNLGVDHPDVASDLSNLAFLLFELQRASDALPLMKRAVAISERTLNAQDPQIGVRKRGLGRILKETGDLEAAEPLMREALAIHEAAVPDSEEFTKSLNDLAVLLQSQKKFDEAEQLMVRQLQLLKSRSDGSGGPHQHLPIALSTYESILESLKVDFQEIDRRLAPYDTPRLAADRYQQRALATFQADMPSSRPHIERAIAAYERLPDPPADQIVPLQCLLGTVLVDLNEPRPAKALLQTAIPQLDQVMPEPAVMHAKARYDLAASLILLRDFDPAEKMLEESIRWYQKIPEQTEHVRRLKNEAIEIYRDTLKSRFLSEAEIDMAVKKLDGDGKNPPPR